MRAEREAVAAEQRRRRYAYGFGALLAVAVAVIVVLAVTRGGADGDGAPGGGAAVAAGHIHGLGVNPADGSLHIATHNGLFRASTGSAEAPRVGTSDRDLMGFSVVGPEHFIASGHPGSENDLPGNIGLTESRDGGRSWRSVSLLGEADFHVLRASGRHVYGFDGPGGRFMASTDLGATWAERDVPSAPFDIAIDPSNPERVLIATEDGLQASRDAARTWQKVSGQIALLAWADTDRLFLLDQRGRVLLSDDGGRTARPAGRIDGEVAAFVATKDAVYVGLADGHVLHSTDDGASFSTRARL